MKKQMTIILAQILRLKTKIKILVKNVKPLIAEYKSFVKINATLSKKKKLKKAHKKKSSSFKQGRKKVSVESTGLNEVDEGSAQANESTFEDFEGFAQANESTFEDFEGTAQANEGTFEDFEGTAQANEGTSEDFEGTAQANEGTAEVNESTVGANLSTAEVNESTVGANLSTEPSMKEVEDEAGPSTFQERPKSPTLILDPKDKGKGIMKEEPKKKKLTLQQLRAAETANDEEFARKLDKRGARKGKIQKSDDELKEFLKVVNFEDDGAQDVEVMEQHSLISRFSIIQSPEGEYIVVQRANGHIRAFNTLNEVLLYWDRHDLLSIG
ncbi:hypothetical protein Tco_1193790 [Tanacetum coccineum]